ncbi:hypothetical protein NQ317_004217 [Molorchus minor]|uniref:Uncharacterized protein n=1 Tax=Molorchus minor TaxID=1323400 RepID=A0ABQ9JL68_9CUCU|nr:hypothetical protein NQ317_004217 [Molorchus minor]
MQTEWGLLLIIFVLVHCTNNIKIEQRMVSYNETFRENINSTCQLVLVYPNISTVNPFRVKAWSTNANIENPVLVVVQQKKQVTSWQVPLLVETRNRKILMFSNTSKTMCHDKMDLIVMHKLSDIVNISPDLPVNNNRLLYQSFILAIASASTTNVNINIQLEEEDGFYLQLNKTYTMSISPSEPRYYFYKFGRDASDTVVIEIESKNKICLIVSVQDSRCPVFDTNKDIKYEGHYQTINLRGAMTVKRSDFGGVFFIVFVAKPDNYDCSQESSYIPRLAKKVPISPLKSMSTVTFKIRNGINQQDYLQASLGTLAAMLILGGILTGLAMIFNRFGTVSKIKCNDDKVMDIYEHLSKDEIKELLHLGKLTVSHFSRYPKTSKQRSYDYLSHTMSTAIFYSIPVVQLVITYQRMVDQTGNEDMFSDRQHLIKPRKDKGIPVHYGIYHAMGVALIIEGLLSASYHICPSQSNYQFDTSFMYIMAVLCMIKLYQNRHPDINANAYSTFTVLGATIFVAMIGILDGSLAIWIIFILAYIILCAVLSFKIYFVNYVLYGVKQLKENYENHGFRNDMLVPIRKARFTLLCITNVANFAMILVGFCLYTDKETDFGTFLLGLLMGNTVIYGGFYVCMKVTPAESRHLNQNCIMLNFFDKHDVWHLLSAPALYFSFMFLMCLDDDIIDTNQKEITVF